MKNIFKETSSAWVPVNSFKTYECQGKVNGVHTMFFASNRSLSSFTMLCLPNGTYRFTNIRSNWPTCLTGKCKRLNCLSHKLFTK